MSKKPGDRVFALRDASEGVLYLYGMGVYEGRHKPPVGTPGPFGMDLSELGDNPRIRLDSGEVVWGGQCWWGPEESFGRLRREAKRVEIVPVPRADGEEEKEDEQEPRG